MNTKLNRLAKVAAVLSSLFCFLGGVWILAKTGFSPKGDDVIWTGIGMYFIGKAFFVGPMLLIASEHLGRTRESK